MSKHATAFALGLLVSAAPLLVLSVTSAPGAGKGETGVDPAKLAERLEAVERAVGVGKHAPRYTGQSVTKRLASLEFAVRGHLPTAGDPISGQLGRLRRDIDELKQNRTDLDREIARLNAKFESMGQAVRARDGESAIRDVVRSVSRLERQVDKLDAEVRRLDARR